MEHETTASEDQNRAPVKRGFTLTRHEWGLILLFLCTLPFTNPWVHGDGVGYYAFARALLIEHRLDFRQDWLQADPEFRLQHTDERGQIPPSGYTATGHLVNHFAIGPAILWLPFLFVTHIGVLIVDAIGGHVPANGFSKPYVVTMAMTTALYGFLALWISFRIARRHLAERWAFLATIGIWAASSLPVYMYLNPSWSHAQSAFTVALFVWYWDATRGPRSVPQWIVLGLIGGLMMDVYYVAAIVLLLPALESLGRYRQNLFSRRTQESARLLLRNLIFLCAAGAAFLPTLITKKIIFGSFFNLGYTEHWFWNSPALLKVCFSSQHGLFSWTPILVPAVLGLLFLAKNDRDLAIYSLIVFAAFLYAIGCYQDWHGISSFGNRLFISLTPIFVLGLAAFFERLESVWSARPAAIVASASTALFILWNLGMMYQWSMHLIPVRGPISWHEAVHNQFAVVPKQAEKSVEQYLFRRSQLLQRIEEEDGKELKSHPQ